MKLLHQLGRHARIVSLTSPAETEGLVQVFERIALDLGWQPGEAIRANQPAAQHMAVTVGESVVGGLQVVLGNRGAVLPYRLVWPEVELPDVAATAHVTILALRPEYRWRFDLFWPLCVELWRLCRTGGIRTILLETAPPTLRLYRRLGWPLEIIGSLRPHWGEDCYLCRMDVRGVAAALTAKAERSQTYCMLVQQAYRDGAAECAMEQPVETAA